jgi:hypothetical protein
MPDGCGEPVETSADGGVGRQQTGCGLGRSLDELGNASPTKLSAIFSALKKVLPPSSRSVSADSHHALLALSQSAAERFEFARK